MNAVRLNKQKRTSDRMNSSIYRIFKLIIPIIFLFLSPLALDAQHGKIKKADRAFERYEFLNAIELYTKALKDSFHLSAGEIDRVELNIAQAYRFMNRPGESAYWYGRMINSVVAEPEHYFSYAQMLMRNEKLKLAKQWFNNYLEEEPGDVRAKKMIQAIDLIDESYSRPTPYLIEHLPLNSPYPDFAAVPWREGLLFTSARDNSLFQPKFKWTNTPFYDLYYAPLDTASATEVKKIRGSVNTQLHEGPASIAIKDSTLFFTRNNYYKGHEAQNEEGIVNLKIYTTTYKKGRWKNTAEISINSNSYTVAHPAVTPDGKRLYFISDMPGGFGGTDIYVSEHIGGRRWSEPQNLGRAVNTDGNEMFPFIWQDSILFFSTDGRTKFGGLDIYVSSRNENSEWDQPKNLGYPINSPADDFSFFINDDYNSGYFSSNRKGGVGEDDIYTFRRNAVPVKGLVTDVVTLNELPGTEVIIKFQESGLTYRTIIVDSNGMFELEIIPGIKYEILFSNPFYKSYTYKLQLNKRQDEVLLPVAMEKKPVAVEISGAIKLDSLASNDSVKVLVIAAPYEGQNIYTLGDTIVKTITAKSFSYRIEMNPYDLMPTQFRVQVSKDSFYNWHQNYLFEGQTNRQFSDTIHLRSIKLGDKFRGGWSLPGNTPQNVEIYRQGDSVYLEFLPLILANPDIIWELGFHTDSRGTDEENLKLSKEWAASVVTRYYREGISKEQLAPKGYGETALINNCDDGVDCNQLEHQENRRVELKVIEFKQSGK